MDGNEAAQSGHTPISFDLACHRCAYNLRGLQRRGRCPECAAPIEVSVAGDALQFADPVWLANLALGAKWAKYTITGVIAATLSAAAIAGVYSGLKDTLLGGIASLAIMSLFYSVWLISSPNPETVSTDGWRSSRRLVRCSVVSAWLGLPCGALLWCTDTAGPLWMWLQVLTAPFGVFGLVGAYGLRGYVVQLADRLDDDFSKRRSRVYFSIFLLGWVCFEPALVLMICNVGFGACLSLPGLAGIVAGGTLMLFLPANLAERLEHKLHLAREIWESADTNS